MKIVVYERVLTHYRLKFYNRLLKETGIKIHFFLTDNNKHEGFGTNFDEALFNIEKINYISFFGKAFPILPLNFLQRNAIFVSVLSIPTLHLLVYGIFVRMAGGKFYWWGHTKNFSQDNFWSRFKDLIKLSAIIISNGFLAYTDQEAERIAGIKIFKRKKIISLKNTLDSKEIEFAKSLINPESLLIRRSKYAKPDQLIIGMIGRMHKNRKTETGILTFIDLKKRHKNLKLLLIGEGEDYHVLKTKYLGDRDIIFLGMIENEMKLAPIILSIDFFINPGLVGLNLVHSMMYGKLTVMRGIKIHSPEIEYAKNWENCIISEEDEDNFIDTIDHIIENPEIIVRIGKNAETFATNHLNILTMCKNFTTLVR